MKLSKIAFSLVALLGISMAGGSWYTGKQVEEHYVQWVEIVNSHLKELETTYGVHAEIKNVKLDRHLFSSEIVYDLETQFSGISDQFSGKGTVYHGPLPLNRLLKGNILPSMISLETNIIAPEALKMSDKSSELLSAKINMSYGETVSGSLVGTGIKSEQFPLELESFSGDFELDKAGKGNITANIPAVRFYNPQKNQQIGVEKLEYKIKLNDKSEYKLLEVGNFEIKAKSYTLSEINPTKKGVKFILSNLKLDGKSKVEQGVYELESNYKGKLDLASSKSQSTFGELKLSIALVLDAKASNTFMAYLNDPEKVKSLKLINEAIGSVLSKPSKFHLKNLSLENNKGKNELSLIINSEGVGEQNLGNLYQLLTIFKQSKLETALNLTSLEEVIKQYYSISPSFNGNAEAIAKNTVNELVYQAKESGIATVDAEKLRLKLEVDKGQVKLNDKDVPEKQVKNALFMMMFGLGSVFK